MFDLSGKDFQNHFGLKSNISFNFSQNTAGLKQLALAGESARRQQYLIVCHTMRGGETSGPALQLGDRFLQEGLTSYFPLDPMC